MQRFFAPGRTELAGNHTDHQLGRVLAASVDVGITARATRRRDRRVCIHSMGFRPFTVALDDLDPHAYGKPWALVRGMAAAILDAGGAVGGFEAWASSALKPGGGLSSSAAFEILVGRIFNALYNGGTFSPEQLARFGQQARVLRAGAAEFDAHRCRPSCPAMISSRVRIWRFISPSSMWS